MTAMRRAPVRSILAIILAGSTGASALGCNKQPTSVVMAPVQVTDAPAIPISSAQFPTTLHQLLKKEDRSPEAKLRLAGAVQYQLKRASELFEKGFTEEAEDMVTGALLLLRHDDELLSATRGRVNALIQAGHAAARSGDAGRAAALYELSLPVAEAKELELELNDHLKAIETFNRAVVGTSALEQLGEQTRTALSRSVVEPNAANYVQAKTAIVGWMRAALASSAGETQPTNAEERELAMEAYRAVRSGAPAMVALNVRQGAPAAAVTALREANLERALPAGYLALLEATERKDSADAWMALFRQFEDSRSEEQSEVSLPRYVNDAASFWAALGLYRHGDGLLENALPLSMILVEFGMPEVASVVLSANSDADTAPEALAWSLTLVLRGLLDLSHSDQLEAARRSYQGALPLFERAQLTLGKSGPDPARAQLLMAALEVRHAHLKEAQQLLIQAQKLSPQGRTSLRLGRIDEQMGRKVEAVQNYRAAITQAQKAGDLLLESESEFALYLVSREAGEAAQAADALKRALERALVLQKMAPTTVSGAEVERHLAGILQYYSATRPMHEAFDRALEQSRANPAELEMTLTDMARVALTVGDQRLGNKAISQAMNPGLAPENAIYIALWYQLLQKQLGQRSDGLSEQLLEQAGRARGWMSILRQFGLGALSTDKLIAAAVSPIEKTEAAFYAALDRHPNPNQAWDTELFPVAKSAAIDLIEVRLATDLRDKARGKPGFNIVLPEDIELP